MKHLFIPTLFFVCILMISACSKQPVNIEAPVNHEYSRPEKPIETAVGQEFSIQLVSNPSTGYGWRLSSPSDGKVVSLVTNTYIHEKTEPRLCGSGGHEIWTFRAAGKGKIEIVMEYLRPWETDVPPIQTKIFNVTVR